jgi:hypothetical protein
VNPLLIDFLNRVSEKRKKISEQSTSSKQYEKRSLSEGLGPWLESKVGVGGMRFIGLVSILPYVFFIINASTGKPLYQLLGF